MLRSSSDITSESLCFDDILLIPQYSELESRTQPDISTKLGHLTIPLPIISSPMDSITGEDMLIKMAEAGGLGILTRFIDEQQLRIVSTAKGLDTVTESLLHVKLIHDARQHLDHIKFAGYGPDDCPDDFGPDLPIGCAIGIKNGPKEHSHVVLDAGCDVICLDVAHGDHKKMYEAIEEVSKLKDKYEFSLMAGNVCTAEATKHFVEAGVDIIKVGIGPGAACTTRRVTGFGMPQLSAVLHCAQAANGQAAIVADGGLRTTGDLIKALWAGADACMVGYMLAGTTATPIIGGEKVYRGMSSRTVSGRKDIAPEGIDMTVEFKGDTVELLEEYGKCLQSGLAMAGAKNIAELRNVKCVMAGPLALTESNPICK